MDKAVIYARVSSKDQEKEGFSIPSQLRLLREYATKNDYRHHILKSDKKGYTGHTKILC